MSYVSTADINAYLGTSGEDTLIGVLNTNAEMILNNLIGTDDLTSKDYTETFNYPTITNDNGLGTGQIFYVKQVNPTVVKEIDSIAVTSSDYEITGNRIYLKTALTYNSDFPFKNSIKYTAGFSTIPADIKQAIYLIVGALYNTKTSQGIESFRQDLLSVNYSQNGTLDKIMDTSSTSLLSSIINKYKVPTILTSGPDRTIIC